MISFLTKYWKYLICGFISIVLIIAVSYYQSRNNNIQSIIEQQNKTITELQAKQEQFIKQQENIIADYDKRLQATELTYKKSLEKIGQNIKQDAKTLQNQSLGDISTEFELSTGIKKAK